MHLLGVIANKGKGNFLSSGTFLCILTVVVWATIGFWWVDALYTLSFLSLISKLLRPFIAFSAALSSTYSKNAYPLFYSGFYRSLTKLKFFNLPKDSTIFLTSASVIVKGILPIYSLLSTNPSPSFFLSSFFSSSTNLTSSEKWVPF
jgi:hypothetical protein